MRLTSKSQQCTNYNITGKLTDFTNKQNSKISKYYNNRLILAMLSGLASSYSSSMLDRAICLLSTSVSIRMSTRMSIRRLWWEWDLLVIWQWHRQKEVLLGLVRLDREGRWVIISILNRAICLLATRVSTRMSIRWLWWKWGLLVICQWYRQEGYRKEGVLLSLVYRLDRQDNDRGVIRFRFICSNFRDGRGDLVEEIVQ